MTGPLLEVDELSIQYRVGDDELTAVSNVSFSVEEGEYFGLVGESGCGKSTIASAILGGLDDNGHIQSGTIRFKGTEIQDLSERDLSDVIRWKEISWIPQGSMNSLDPLQRISEQASNIANKHTDLTREEAIDKLAEMFETVGLNEERITDYPHQFSGGMQQRALIALALFLEPSLIIADEPTTALDVIMQDQIFKYLNQLQEFDTSMILITHDISLVFQSCDKMAIMHAGQLSEIGPVEQVFDSPRHPYAILLQEAFPDIRYPDRELGVIGGNPPQNMGTVDYCTFADRCPWAVDDCHESAPPLEPVAGPDGGDAHRVACIRKDEAWQLYEAGNAAGAESKEVESDE